MAQKRRTKVLAFTGFTGTGKSTTAETINPNLITSIATPLREKVMEVWNLPEEGLLTHRKDEIIPWLGVTGRDLLKAMWEMTHPLDPQLYVRSMSIRSQGNIIDDFRFRHEHSYLSEYYDLRFYNLYRPEIVESYGIRVDEYTKENASTLYGRLHKNHASEKDFLLLPYEHDFVNISDILELRNLVEECEFWLYA